MAAENTNASSIQGIKVSHIPPSGGEWLILNPSTGEYEPGSVIPTGGDAITIDKTGHGFSVLDPIYFDGSSWQLAKADDPDTLASYVISEIVTVNQVKARSIGEIEAVGHGLTVGEFYFTSDSVAGEYTLTSPVLSNPLFQVLDSNNLIIVVNYRPIADTSVAGNVDGGTY